MVAWAGRVAIADVQATHPSKLNEDRFYRNLDTLHGKWVEIEQELHAREKSLVNLQGQARTQQAIAHRLQAGGDELDAGR